MDLSGQGLWGGEKSNFKGHLTVAPMDLSGQGLWGGEKSGDIVFMQQSDSESE